MCNAKKKIVVGLTLKTTVVNLKWYFCFVILRLWRVCRSKQDKLVWKQQVSFAKMIHMYQRTLLNGEFLYLMHFKD